MLPAFITSYVLMFDAKTTFTFCRLRADSATFALDSGRTSRIFLPSRFRFLVMPINSLVFGGFHREILHDRQGFAFDLIGKGTFTGELFEFLVQA